jgi:FkbM family methyltransferase
LLSKLVGPNGKVVAFEPLPANYRLLEENLQLNRIANVTAERAAVTGHSGQISFNFPADAPWLIAGPVLATDNQGTFSVPSVSIDDFLFDRQIPVHFIKMDIEGAEAIALRGARRTLEQYHPDLVIELHSSGEESPMISIPWYLREFGYEIQWLTEETYTTHILATWRMKNVNIR